MKANEPGRQKLEGQGPDRRLSMESHILTHSKLAGAFDAAGFSAAGVLISASAVGLPRYGGEGRREEGREEGEKERGRERERAFCFVHSLLKILPLDFFVRKHLLSSSASLSKFCFYEAS